MDEKTKKDYQSYVKKVTPTRSLPVQMLKAFITGGIICVIGQGILEYLKSIGIDKETSGIWCAVILVFISALLTGFGIYARLTKWGGAGFLVPITGFANSMVAPAMEYKKEGPVLGSGAKMFTVAGPVLVCGITSATIVGIIYWIIGLF